MDVYKWKDKKLSLIFSNILVFLFDEDANLVDEDRLSYSLGFIISGYLIGTFLCLIDWFKKQQLIHDLRQMRGVVVN